MTAGKISLSEALGISNNTPPDETSRRWLLWKNTWPDEYNSIRLTPAALSLDALSVPIAVYNTALDTYKTAKATYDAAAAAYKAAITAAALINPAAAAELVKIVAAEAYNTAVTTVKNVATDTYTAVHDAVQQTFNTEVSAGATLDE